MHPFPRKQILVPALALTAFAGQAAPPARAHDHRDREVDRRIVFLSSRTGDSEVFVMNEDGSDPENLTKSPATSDTWPAGSPDGERIAFVRGRGFGRELFIMNRDGTDTRQITHNTAAELAPSWSPDGRWIAVGRFAPDFTFHIWVVDTEGLVPDRQLTSGDGFDLRPAWSPNGRWIAYSSDFEGFNAVYKVRADGSGEPRRLTPPELNGGGSAWSRDGESIVFSDNVCSTCDQSDVWSLDLEDGNLRRLTDTPDQNELFPSWSDDGKRLVYESSEFLDGALGLPDIWAADRKGRRATNLTESPDVFDGMPGFLAGRQSDEDDGDKDEDDDRER